MIPKIAFTIWIGSDPPAEIRALVDKAKRVNDAAGWTYTFHGPEIFAKYEQDPYVRRMVAMKEKLAFITDRIRLLMLRETGGFWVDAEADFQRPMSNLNKIVERPDVDFVTGVRNPHRPQVALHRGISLVDNTVMGSAPNGRMVNRILALYTAENPKQTGYNVGVEILRSVDESVVLLNYERFYTAHEPITPNTILLHDANNLASHSPRREFPPIVLK